MYAIRSYYDYRVATLLGIEGRLEHFRIDGDWERGVYAGSVADAGNEPF